VFADFVKRNATMDHTLGTSSAFRWAVALFVSAAGMLTTQSFAEPPEWLNTIGKKFVEMAAESASSSLDGAMQCAVGDPKCSIVKCRAADVRCLEHAGKNGKRVAIVEEETELDRFHCATTDLPCLRRAQVLGKRVEIVD
jgi:hypothetical protein